MRSRGAEEQGGEAREVEGGGEKLRERKGVDQPVGLVNCDVRLLVQPAAKRRQKVARGKRAARRPWITSERISAPWRGATIAPGVSETRDSLAPAKSRRWNQRGDDPPVTLARARSPGATICRRSAAVDANIHVDSLLS